MASSSKRTDLNAKSNTKLSLRRPHTPVRPRAHDAKKLLENFLTSKKCSEIVRGQTCAQLPADATISTSLHILIATGLSGVPVQLPLHARTRRRPRRQPHPHAGVFSMRSLTEFLLREVAPQTIRSLSARTNVSRADLSLMFRQHAFGPDRPVLEFCPSDPFAACYQSDNLCVAVSLLQRGFRQVFVCNSRGALIGSISPSLILTKFVLKYLDELDYIFDEPFCDMFPSCSRRHDFTIGEDVRCDHPPKRKFCHTVPCSFDQPFHRLYHQTSN